MEKNWFFHGVEIREKITLVENDWFLSEEDGVGKTLNNFSSNDAKNLNISRLSPKYQKSSYFKSSFPSRHTTSFQRLLDVYTTYLLGWNTGNTKVL